MAEEDGAIVAHILFSRMTTEPVKRIAGLGPVAVTPEQQNRGFGEALCRAGLGNLRSMGAEAVVVLGHPSYYPRFGFSHEAAAQIGSPFSARPARVHGAGAGRQARSPSRSRSLIHAQVPLLLKHRTLDSSPVWLV